MKDILPANKPRYLMGVGSPDDLVVGSMMGVDMFDCVAATRIARHGTALTHKGKLLLKIRLIMLPLFLLMKNVTVMYVKSILEAIFII